MALRDKLRERTAALRITAKELAWLEAKFPNLVRTAELYALRDLVGLRRELQEQLRPRSPRRPGTR